MKKLVILLLSLVVLFSFTPTVCADNIEEAQPAGNFSIFNVVLAVNFKVADAYTLDA